MLRKYSTVSGLTMAQDLSVQFCENSQLVRPDQYFELSGIL